MAKLFIDSDKYGERAKFATVEAYHAAVKELVRKRLDQAGVDWASFVFDKSLTLITADDLKAIEAKLLKAGHRFDYSAIISVQERPEAYKPVPGLGDAAKDYSFEHPDAPTAAPDANGRALQGVGDNVVKHPANVTGIARYVRTSAMVMDYLTRGVPPDTIAIIDDSGGTLTAPILEQFKGIICLGGSTRSHLGILAREYGIPCLMNSKIKGIKEGDTVELESSAAAKTAEAYQTGKEMTANIWKLKGRG